MLTVRSCWKVCPDGERALPYILFLTRGFIYKHILKTTFHSPVNSRTVNIYVQLDLYIRLGLIIIISDDGENIF